LRLRMSGKTIVSVKRIMVGGDPEVK